MNTTKAVVETMTWDVWETQNPPIRYRGGQDLRLRAAEPDEPDVTGKKYMLGSSTRRMTLSAAADQFSEDDRKITVHGSGRVVAVWKKREGLRESVPCIHWVGASVAEANALHDLLGVGDRKGEDVILRVRMKRATLNRVKRAADYEQSLFGDGRRGQYMSAFALSAILARLDEVEAAQQQAETAGFKAVPSDRV